MRQFNAAGLVTRVKLQDRFVVSGSPEAAAAFMLNIDQVSRCIPEVHDVKETEPNAYDANLIVQLGPIKATFAGSVRVDADGAPARLAAAAQGRDRASGSVAKVIVNARLEQLPDSRTSIEIDTDLTIRGKLGQFGTAVIRSTATALIKDFAKCLDAQLSVQHDNAAHPSSVPSRGRALKLGIATIGEYFRNLWAAVRSRLLRRTKGTGNDLGP